jgi:hypothetical protein
VAGISLSFLLRPFVLGFSFSVSAIYSKIEKGNTAMAYIFNQNKMFL